jgi:hypothetical protein
MLYVGACHVLLTLLDGAGIEKVIRIPVNIDFQKLGLPSSQAIYLEREIERFMGIENVHVDGEM